MTRWRWLLALLSLLVAPARAEAEATGTVTVAGHVRGGKGGHTIYVTLWDEAGFLLKPAQRVKIAAGADAAFHFDVAPGRWAISAFEDRNENGLLDSGMFGPKEPAGFARAFHGWHKPRFEEVATTIAASASDLEIKLR